MLRRSLFLLLTLVPGLVFAQKGTIRGKVIDDSNGEALIGVAVIITGTSQGAVTDFDGDFEISAEPGTYSLTASYVSFADYVLSDVAVESGKVTALGEIRLKEDVQQLAEIVVQADAIRNTETSLMTMKRKSPAVIDGISAAGFRQIGDSDAGQAAKRVTGVTVEGGKYVYVRGLGDRYTKTTLNNVDVPGLDPDRNSIQIDIFPTSLIDNMVIYKSFVPELPADFTGGMVDIETKDFPDERLFSITLKAGYNPSMHFNSDFLTYPGSNTDVLGFDNGTRALPERAFTEPIPTPLSGDPENVVNSFLKDFNPTLGAENKSSPMNYNMGLTYANQFSLRGGKKLGVILSGTHRITNVLYQDVYFGEYQRPIPADEFEMVYATTLEGTLAEKDALLGGLAGLALKTSNSRFKFNLMHLQNGISRAGQFFIDDNGEAPGKSGYTGYSDNLEYNQRGLTNMLLNGAHFNKDASWKIDWRASLTLSTLEDPDIRKTAFTVNEADGSLRFIAGAAGNPNRIWRYLDEVNIVGKIDVIREYRMFGHDARLKFGVSQVYKERDYNILSFDVQFFGRQPDFGGNPNNVFAPANLFPNNTVYLSSGNNVPNPNEYNSTANNTAFYVSDEFTPFRNIKTILGLRGEHFVQRHTGRDVEFANSGTAGRNLENEEVLNSFDLFPLVSLTWSVKDNQNLRLVFTKTIARPSFKELSFAQILDPVTNRIFNGGFFQYADWDGNLVETRINNFDLRWERYSEGGQLISASAFYKTFRDPIELVRIPAAQTTNEFQPRNVGDSRIYGFELELRKSLKFIAPALQHFSVVGNYTYARSELKMNITEFNSRKGFEKVGETITDTREMAGQSPYIINAGLSYVQPVKGLEAGLYYNVKGRTLTVVGGGLFPDVYAQPFHSLNFNMNKSIGAARRANINFSVTNILNDQLEEFFVAFGSADRTFTRFIPATEIALGFGYQF